MIRSAVLLYGLLPRSLGFTHRSLERCLLEPLRAAGSVELFYHSWRLDVVDNLRSGECRIPLDAADIARYLPGARGLIEEQADFDREQDWEPLLANNIMRKCTHTEAAAEATLMNLFRALASLERVWKYFCAHRQGAFQRLVVIRPDLRLLTPIPLPAPDDGLWLPDFQDWGGFNDRFALGSETAIGLYCRRRDFSERCLRASDEGNAEKLLERWLVGRHGLAPRRLDWTFARVRADGHWAPADLDSARDFVAARRPSGSDSAADDEHFLIVSQRGESGALALQGLLARLGQAELIVLRPEAQARGWWYPPELLKTLAAGADGPPGWAAALLHVSLCLPGRSVWLVDETVAGSFAAFARLVALTRQARADLALWADSGWQNALPPLCRLSGSVLAGLLRPSAGTLPLTDWVARQGGTRLEWRAHPATSSCFASFGQHPVERIGPGISYPVTNLYAQLRICQL